MSLVSIVIPAYNKAEFTARAVDSVLSQTYKDIEIIVVDDGSTDNTRQRLSVYGDRIHYIYKENGGACSARNLGIRQARGELIGFLDCDDMYAPDKIEKCVQYLDDHPEMGFVHTAAHFIDRDDRVVGAYFNRRSRHQGLVSRQLMLGNFICNSTVIVRHSSLDAVGLYDESIFAPADWDLWIRLAEKCPMGYIRLPLTMYRVSDNYIFSWLELAQKEERVVITKYFIRNPSITERFKDRVLSNHHVRFSGCYFIKDDINRMKLELRRALGFCPWNWKALGLGVVSIVASMPLKKFLRTKILHYEGKVNAV